MLKNILKSLNLFDIIILVIIISLFFVTFKKKSKENFSMIDGKNLKAIHDLKEHLNKTIEDDKPLIKTLVIKGNESYDELKSFIDNYIKYYIDEIHDKIEQKFKDNDVLLNSDIDKLYKLKSKTELTIDKDKGIIAIAAKTVTQKSKEEAEKVQSKKKEERKKDEQKQTVPKGTAACPKGQKYCCKFLLSKNANKKDCDRKDPRTCENGFKCAVPDRSKKTGLFW